MKKQIVEPHLKVLYVHTLTKIIEKKDITTYLRSLKLLKALDEYMKSKGFDSSWWENVKTGNQDPWVKLQENDPNKQCMQFQQNYQVPTA